MYWNCGMCSYQILIFTIYGTVILSYTIAKFNSDEIKAKFTYLYIYIMLLFLLIVYALMDKVIKNTYYNSFN